MASRATDAGSAAQAGALAAGVVGLIGAPLAFLPRWQQTGVAYQSRGTALVRIPNFTRRPRLALHFVGLR
jgi:hypothetical protein